METPRERFISLLRSTGAAGVEDLIAWLDGPHCDFFVAPASTKYHCAYEGGLVDHSLAVFDECVRLYNAFQDRPEFRVMSKASVIKVALLHDVCKANMYKSVEKSRKNASGSWEKYMGWDHDEQFKFGGHGSKSVFIVSRYLDLTDEEAAAINCHMGTWDAKDVQPISQVFNENPLAWMLHVADESATFVMKK